MSEDYDFRASNPDLKSDDFQTFDPPKDIVDDKTPNRADSETLACGLVWLRADGYWQVSRATVGVQLIVNNVRNGRVVSGGSYWIAAGTEVRLLYIDSRNYDGYNC